jgi:ABC-type multidrug transport system ATPase subunit
MEELLQFVEEPIAYITSNPRDCLAFGTPWQVLTAARLCARSQKIGDASPIEDVAEDYGVIDNLYQPIRTLSGGETVKLALAKTFLLASFCRRLTIASPFSWLSRENGVYFEKLYNHYVNIGLPIELLALDGEDSTEPYEISGTQSQALSAPVEFSIIFNDVTVPLSTSLNPLQPQSTTAGVDDLKEDLLSPCLIVGENGQGKSLVAKALSGAISIQGTAEVTSKHNTGPARLLFQDVITQTLLRSFDGIAASASRIFGENPLQVYDRIFQAYTLNLQEIDNASAEFDLSEVAEFRSLLEIKALLVAVRLCGRPGALILDEPDWGLNRASAIAFVLAVISVAHGLKIPVLIISHKPWWLKITNSSIRLQRTEKEMDKDGNCSFRIKQTCGAPFQ